MSKRILYLGLDPASYQAQGQVTHWPIIRIVPRSLKDFALQRTLCAFNTYSHIIISSKSTVTILADYLARLGISLHNWTSKTTIAVGQVTAKHLTACGIAPTIVAQEETAEGIIAELKQLSLKHAHVFWPHSAQARSVIKDFLMAQQIHHTTCVLYDPVPQAPDHLPNLDHFDEIVFTSPSTVNAFLSIFGELPKNLILTSIGPITARYLEEQSAHKIPSRIGNGKLHEEATEMTK